MTITLPTRRDAPKEAGEYLVRRRGCTTPEVAFYSDRDSTWKSQGRRIEVSAWEGPIHQERGLG